MIMRGATARVAALFCAASLLGGCNLVISRAPVFTQADTAGAPAIRPGLWISEKTGCHFDETMPTDKWPDCADPLIITSTEFRGVGAKAQGQAAPYLLAAGDPLVLQARTEIAASASASATGDATASASASVTTDPNSPPPYVFLGVRPLSFDRQGRVVRMEQWPAMCGPPPPPAPGGGAPPAKTAYVTRDPLPGLSIEGDDCTPSGKAAVINAARESRAYSDVQTAHWVRDTAP